MFRTLSSNVLLKSVIVVMATTIVLVLGSGAWTAWQTLATANRVSDVAGAAGHLFRAMSTLRMSRAITIRTLNIDAPANADQTKMVAGFTATITPALQASLKALPGIDFPGRAERVATLAQLLQTQMRLDGEIAANLAKPKPQRRAGLAREAEANMTGLLDVINAINPAIAKVVMNNEAFVDQMMQLKDAAWLVRDNGGAASATVASALAFKQRVPEGTVQTLWNQIGRLDAGWQIIESARSGLAPASPLHAAMDKAKALFFAPDYVATRRQTIAALAAGQPVDIKSSDWSVDSIPRLQSLVALAETALDAATDHAQAKVAEARTNLIVSLALLIGALALAAGGLAIVSRRVIRPLQGIQGAMVKVADGDLSVEVPYRDRTDEIGSLAAALATFKENALEKARIEAEQSRRRDQAGQRQQAVERAIGEFEAGIGAALEALGSAAGEMRRTSETLTATATQTNGQAHDAAVSSDEAAQNVQTVAAASEELSSSIGEISRQVSHAATVAKRAVTETQETDATVQGLTDAAHRIGEIVSLITAIASQTNLLALNATIEAARAGEAGKGFAVVASEVKNLAGQTAKATEDISSQVGAIQEVADQALAAMRRIGTTIAEVSTVASSIAAAVEEQGAATAEITRNTQEAARRTQNVTDNIAGVRACADQTGTAAGGVESSAAVLTEEAARLRSEVDSFLEKIRAA